MQFPRSTAFPIESSRLLKASVVLWYHKKGRKVLQDALLQENEGKSNVFPIITRKSLGENLKAGFPYIQAKTRVVFKPQHEHHQALLSATHHLLLRKPTDVRHYAKHTVDVEIRHWPSCYRRSHDASPWTAGPYYLREMLYANI